MNRNTSALLRLWRRIENIGLEGLTDPTARDHGRLLNQWIAYGIGFALWIMTVTAAIYLYLFFVLELSEYREVIGNYLAAEISPVLVGLLAFVVHKYRPQWEMPMVWLYFIAYSSMFFLLAVFMGQQAGIHYALLTVVFIFYVFFPENPRRYLPLMAFQVVAYLACTWTILVWPAAYPLPREITQLVFKIVVPGIIGFSLLAFFYIGLYFRVFRKVYRWWKKITNLGAESFATAAERKSNEIINAGFIVSLLVGSVLILCAIATLVLTATASESHFVRNTFVYLLLSLSFTGWSWFLFRRKIRSGRNTLYQVVGAFSGILFTASGAIALGRETYFYLLVYPLMVMPFFFAGISRMAMALYESVFMLIALATTFLVHDIEAIMPLPTFMVSTLAGLSRVFAGLLVLGVIVYGWWKYDLRTRLRLAWRSVSRFGISHTMTPQQAKTVVLTNISIYVDLAVLVSVAIFTLVIYLKGYVSYAYCIPPAIISGAILLIFFWVRLRESSGELMLLLIFFLSLLNGFILSIMLGESFNVHYFFYATLVVPYFVFNSSQKKWIVTCNILTIAAIYATFRHFNNYPPLVPPPDTEINSLIRNFVRLAINGFVVLALATIAYYFWRESDIVEDNLEIARQESDNLLLNILPADIARELKEKGTTTPRFYDAASVLFTDFVGFTNIAEKMSAEDLVGELDHCFTYFDTIMKKFGLERIKTIGDSYMAAAGIPEPCQTHAVDCVLAALAISAFMDELKLQKTQAGLESWDLRIGIHSGPLVAGVVGERKFAYDCWGDTVNTASRMESSGAPGRVNVSLQTWELVRKFFDGEERGKVSAKQKGEMEMFFVNGLKREYAEDDGCTVPNARFREAYESMAKIGTY